MLVSVATSLFLTCWCSDDLGGKAHNKDMARLENCDPSTTWSFYVDWPVGLGFVIAVVSA